MHLETDKTDTLAVARFAHSTMIIKRSTKSSWRVQTALRIPVVESKIVFMKYTRDLTFAPSTLKSLIVGVAYSRIRNRFG